MYVRVLFLFSKAPHRSLCACAWPTYAICNMRLGPVPRLNIIGGTGLPANPASKTHPLAFYSFLLPQSKRARDRLSDPP